jgi:ZIP family zinc transporter
LTGEALAWGALAASSLVIGALIGLARRWPRQLVGLVLGFGAGALISAVSFELAQEGVEIGGTTAVAVGLGVGALTYFAAAGLLASRMGATETSAGTALAL